VNNKEIEWLLKEKYQGVESKAFHADCARLEDGVPLAHLIGHVPFLNCTIYLDSHPLIPRPETEYWVEKAIIEIKKRYEVRGPTPYLRVLDLCAGSGAIGVAVATAIPEAHVTFAELDPAHLLTIEKNLKLNLDANVPINRYIDTTNQYEVIESDLFSQIKSSKTQTSEAAINRCVGQFDFILSNPPYIDAEAHTVDDNVAAHEPHLALFGGVAGMDIITRIIAESKHYLTPTGELWIEHEPAQVETITTLATAHGFTSITHPDQYGVPRFSVLTMAQ
jgi:release factor glutamine methyltransferase